MDTFWGQDASPHDLSQLDADSDDSDADSSLDSDSDEHYTTEERWQQAVQSTADMTHEGDCTLIQ